MKQHIITPFFILIAIIFSAAECSKKDIAEVDELTAEDSIYYHVNGVMKYYYLWNDRLPDVNYLSYDSPEDLLEALRYKPIDKWSYIEETENLKSAIDDGEYFGFGFYIKWDEFGYLRVFQSYKNSQAFKAGITRGTRITQINDKYVRSLTQEELNQFYDDSDVSIKFTYRDEYERSKEITLQKEIVRMNGVIYSDTLKQNGKTIGYLVYDSFLEYTKDDLLDKLSEFKSAKIDELVIDLRYNGGGHSYIAEILSEIIITPNYVGNENYSILHNYNVGEFMDTTIYFKEHELNLNLNRVFIIVSEYTASASEMIINCLDPYIDVITIGHTTHGKPVGMYSFNYKNWEFYPVSSKIVNALGKGDYYNGIDPMYYTDEDITKAWGDMEANCLYQALYYIEKERFDYSKAALKSSEPNPVTINLPKFKNMFIVSQ